MFLEIAWDGLSWKIWFEEARRGCKEAWRQVPSPLEMHAVLGVAGAELHVPQSGLDEELLEQTPLTDLQ